ncbi:MAG: flagellar basal body rod protein FlgC [Candidatus Zixiibacteriota bacterium]|nr:MAG: flagellar basal body rod protein FlgC [candidate division Zixibacteria bacterium]
MGGILNAIEISSQGLSVQRSKMNVVARNLANAETAETAEGGPYRRRRVYVAEQESGDSFSGHLRRAGRQLAQTHPSHRPAGGSRMRTQSELRTVEAKEAIDTDREFRLVHDPSHPNADENGYVRMPDINVIDEMVDMMAASRGYEANTVAISAAKKMADDALEI